MALSSPSWRGLNAIPAASQGTAPFFASGARTIYEAIDFSAPRSAASAFLDAWARRDYATAHLVLTPQAQGGWREQFARTFDMRTLFPARAREVLETSGFLRSDDAAEQSYDPTLAFDAVLRAAEKLDVLPFSLGAGYAVLAEAAETNAAKVDVETRAKPERLTLELVRLPSGRWKVDRVALPDGAPGAKPWGYALKR